MSKKNKKQGGQCKKCAFKGSCNIAKPTYPCSCRVFKTKAVAA